MMASGFGRRSQPPSPAMRLSALALLLLVALDLLFEFALTGESPLWFNLSQLLARLLEIELAPNRLWLSLALSVLALSLAALLWFSGSRLAALLLLAMAGWELFFRVRQLLLALDEGFVLGLPILSGLVAAALLLLVAGAATVSSLGQIRRKRWWR